ncbi:type IV pilin protein [Bacillus fonticola]|uniref:type IV pilin protein n=1 Tax=Bacillus fonticola TaxID=2728853 RepID=UPI001D13358F|nr:prepilin-type N-terminal cleavage/methylation domain-containing protein [Bacillus fonticola]
MSLRAYKKKMISFDSKNKGFTLIEVMAVLTILGILTAIAVPSLLGVIEKAERDVCRVNVLQLERLYERYLVLEGIEHTDVVFDQYLRNYGEEICSEQGDVTYVDGRVRFSDFQSDDRDENGGVPFL